MKINYFIGERYNPKNKSDLAIAKPDFIDDFLILTNN
ncbi:hypothetical protein NIES37_53110 [Tolypothrix tenuis PCC 7101]|uniref:Uncharacterized protein n=1 Tax=Tolypothrix tenuis PCC 7101 TaxID=231146 RepID=A0A1Z4N6M1_9CYAN|nr:hypothetical protein NIES37_53110 [Tolypothrix tenuis PCC 7101]BAZ74765.1 hypothetical protein NIES50_33440 [Aulosira laxa NIES-50]